MRKQVITFLVLAVGWGSLTLAQTFEEEMREVKQTYQQFLTRQRQPAQVSEGGLEPYPNWPTWVIASASEFRPAAPPDLEATQQEINRLESLVSERDPEVLDQIAYWDAGSPGYRWNELATSAGLRHGLGLRNYRMLALLNVAIYDATVAAWEAKQTYQRPRPSEVAPGLVTVLPTPRTAAYPSEHAVAAGAASTVLGYLFPEDAEMFRTLSEEAAWSRVLAGVQYESDVVAGLELGRKVAEQVIQWAKADGSDVEWTGSVPEGPGLWQGEPFEAMMGTWRTWVLSDGAQLRPPPPPAFDSAERAAEVAEVKTYARDANPGSEIGFWPEDPAGRPSPGSVPISSSQVVFYYAPLNHLLWLSELTQKLFEYRVDTDPLQSARAYALVSIAAYDAAVAGMEAKYHYWTARPYHFDPTITTVLPQYPIPDYPSLHAVGAGASSEVLAYLFPQDAQFFRSRAVELAESRIWAGIHFRSAVEAGLELGRGVARLVIERDQHGRLMEKR
jgi:membrane-associated phospholipid phosphatase